MANPNPTNLTGPGPGRKKGSKNKRTAVLDALEAVYKKQGEEGELGFWKGVARQAKNQKCIQSQKLIADRIQPSLKAVEVAIEGGLDVTNPIGTLKLAEIRERLISDWIAEDPDGAARAAGRSDVASDAGTSEEGGGEQG